MATFDLLGAIGLTAGAAVLIGTLAASLSGPPTARIGVGAVLGAWFVLIVAMGTLGTFDSQRGAGTPGLGIAVLFPVLALSYAGIRSETVRSVHLGIPVASLVGANAIRLLGMFFVLLHADGRLPAPFALAAGWGDILVGVTALPVAWSVAWGITGWRPLALTWNTIGLADLVDAIGLGVTSAEDSPVRLFFGEPSTAIMTDLPWVLIPAFIVPILMLTHLAVFYRLMAPTRSAHPVRA